MFGTLIASVLMVSAPAQTQADVALYAELESLQKELESACAVAYKGFVPLKRQLHVQMGEDAVLLRDKLALVNRMMKMADEAATRGARVAERFERSFGQVRRELKWGALERRFREQYNEMFVNRRAEVRVLRLSLLVGHRWPGERAEAAGLNQCCYTLASQALLREAPDHRDLLLWRVAWAEVFCTDAWGALAKAPPARLARGD